MKKNKSIWHYILTWGIVVLIPLQFISQNLKKDFSGEYKTNASIIGCNNEDFENSPVGLIIPN